MGPNALHCACGMSRCGEIPLAQTRVLLGLVDFEDFGWDIANAKKSVASHRKTLIIDESMANEESSVFHLV